MLCRFPPRPERGSVSPDPISVYIGCKAMGLTAARPGVPPMGPQAASRPKTLSERADDLEHHMMEELDAKIASRSADKIATNPIPSNLPEAKPVMSAGARRLRTNPGNNFSMGKSP